MYQLAAERITRVKTDSYNNAIMQRGIELEEEAKAMYELLTGGEVKTVGFCYKDEARRYGCSPDGLVGASGALEIKCPTSPIHIEYLLNGGLPTAYLAQIQGQLLVTGRAWVDFFSFYPGLKPLLIKVQANKFILDALSNELDRFCIELDEVTEKLRGI